jgi:alpha-tubulin suppressor-like RCC1 family protein
MIIFNFPSIFRAIIVLSIISVFVGCSGGGSNTSKASISISGTILGDIQKDVTVSLSGASSATTKTDSNGNYKFTGLVDGSFNVTPSLEGYGFSPICQALNVNGVSLTHIDFTATSQTANVGNWSKVDAGKLHTIAIKTDGTLWAWGSNKYGQLGDGTNTDRFTPTQIGTDKNWAVVSAGNYNTTMAIKTDGTLWAWGSNYGGRLGDGTEVDKNVPTQIGTDKDWAVVSAGDYHTVALKTNGSLWAWGLNYYGQLGDGTSEQKTVPTWVDWGCFDWRIISAGMNFTLAIKADGSLWCWGDNYYGQLGDGSNGTNAAKYSLTQIGIDKDWASVSAGGAHSVAIKTNGSLWAWGDNNMGQIGDGTSANKNIPNQIGVDKDWAVVSAGTVHTMAIKTNGTIWAWGSNGSGQLGDGTNSDKHVPTQFGDGNVWAGVSAGLNHTLAIKIDGTLWGWGLNSNGQIGYGTSTSMRIIPTQIY